ncbi:MAG TPA: thioredoxin [Firmicutes bacterium]|nr:thioredoxin [Bacillota bacterium]
MAENTQNTENTPTPSRGVAGKVLIVAVVAAAVLGVIYVKGRSSAGPSSVHDNPGEGYLGATVKSGEAVQPETAAPLDSQPKAIPRLVDLGAKKCVPCVMMAPILEELAEEYKGRLIVEFIDVWENRGAGREYGIRVIPTQIFYDASGKELFRHEGFYSKADILGTFERLGISFTQENTNEQTN